MMITSGMFLLRSPKVGSSGTAGSSEHLVLPERVLRSLEEGPEEERAHVGRRLEERPACRLRDRDRRRREALDLRIRKTPGMRDEVCRLQALEEVPGGVGRTRLASLHG